MRRIIVGLPADRRRRRHRGRRRCRAFRFGIGIGGHLSRSRLAGTLDGRQLQQTAAVEQRHRHLERTEHDHDHARTNQQRADLGGDRRRFLVAGSRGRRLGLNACGLGGFGGLGRFSGWLLRSRGRLGSAACGGYEARRGGRLRLGRGNFADGAFGSGDALRGRRRPSVRSRSRFERVIRRQAGFDRSARRRGIGLQNLADGARRDTGDGRGRHRGRSMEFARRGVEMRIVSGRIGQFRLDLRRYREGLRRCGDTAVGRRAEVQARLRQAAPLARSEPCAGRLRSSPVDRPHGRACCERLRANPGCDGRARSG